MVIYYIDIKGLVQKSCNSIADGNLLYWYQGVSAKEL